MISGFNTFIIFTLMAHLVVPRSIFDKHLLANDPPAINDADKELKFISTDNTGGLNLLISDRGVPVQEPPKANTSTLVLNFISSSNSNGLNQMAARSTLPEPSVPGTEEESSADTEDTPDPSSGANTEVIKKISETVVLTILLILVMAYTLGALVFVVVKVFDEMRLAILNGYAQFPEKNFPSKALFPSQNKSLKKFEWKQFPEIAEITTERLTTYQGETIVIENKGKGKSLLIAQSSFIRLEKTESRVFYWEIEIQSLAEEAKVIIGWIEKEAVANITTEVLGRFQGSVGFSIVSGNIYVDNEQTCSFNLKELMASYLEKDMERISMSGNFFGAGINMHTGKMFFSFNGVILDSLSFKAGTEMRYRTYEMKRKDLLDAEEGVRGTKQIAKVVRKLDLKKEYRDEIKNMKELNYKWTNPVPAIYVNGQLRVETNVGGSPFQLRDREIKHGILMGKP